MTRQQAPAPYIEDRRGIDPSWDFEGPLQFSPELGAYDPFKEFRAQAGELLGELGLADEEVEETTLVLDPRGFRSFDGNTLDVPMSPASGSENADGSFSILVDGVFWSSRGRDRGLTPDQAVKASVVEVLSHAASRIRERREDAERAERAAWRAFAKENLRWTQRHPRAAGAAATASIVGYAAAISPALIVPAVIADGTLVQPKYEQMHRDRLSAKDLWRGNVWLPQRRSEWHEIAQDDRQRYLSREIGRSLTWPRISQAR